jgi:alpha-L-rhamnosidase
MLPGMSRAQAATRLVDNIKSYDYHLTTGFLGTPYLCEVLSRYGHSDIAYRLLMQESYPSWLYPVKMGATTIWERWDGIRPDSSFQTPGMNSFNHYSYGAIGDWMYRVAAGIDTYDDGAGYKHSRIWPHIGGGLTRVAADLETGYGRLSSHWQLENDSLRLDVEIPANTVSVVYVPAADGGAVTESGQSLKMEKDIEIIGMENGYLTLKLGSGVYHFRTKP